MGEDKKSDESTKQESMFTIISQWISELVETETLPEEIVALNFGLYETPKGYCIYLNGSEEYDEEDEDWACNNDYDPDENGFMEMLIGDNVDWEYFLEGVKESLTWLLANNEGFKNWVGNRHVATGFDDGDLILLK